MTPQSTLGLPAGVRACLFDLDGVLTQTARCTRRLEADVRRISAQAGHGDGEPFVPFDAVADYDHYVDGKPRDDGTRSFLRRAGSSLPRVSADDPPAADTIHGIGNRKNELVLALLREDGVAVYDGSVRYLRAVRAAGLRRPWCRRAATAERCSIAAGIDGSLRRARRRRRRRRAPSGRQTGARHLPGRGRALGVAAAAGGRLRGRARRRRSGPRRTLRLRRWASIASGRRAELRSHGADVVVNDLAASWRPR